MSWLYTPDSKSRRHSQRGVPCGPLVLTHWIITFCATQALYWVSRDETYLARTMLVLRFLYPLIVLMERGLGSRRRGLAPASKPTSSVNR